jgi:ribosome-associated protein
MKRSFLQKYKTTGVYRRNRQYQLIRKFGSICIMCINIIPDPASRIQYPGSSIPTMIERDFTVELKFSATRSSGPGGQNVNKVSTKVELRLNIDSSSLLTEDEKVLLTEKLATRITVSGDLILVSQSERSQLKNKEKVIEKFYALLKRALTPKKERKPTVPSKASKEERLEEKRNQSEKKNRRRTPSRSSGSLKND